MQKSLEKCIYGSKDADTIILNLSAQMRNTKFVPGETCIILDEFDLPREKTIVKKASHWDIGQTWND